MRGRSLADPTEEAHLNARITRRTCNAMLASAIPAIALDRSVLAQPAITKPAIAQPASAQPPAATDEREWHQGLSLYGDLKYKPDFKHFDYVNVNAPKGGVVRLTAQGTFDNFNPVVADMKGSMAAGVDGLVFESLTTSAFDEVASAYGLLAESVSYPEDYSSVTYRLRPQAKWHDGRPVTVEDVIFSFNAYKQHSPRFSLYYQHVTKIEKTGERDVTFTFDAPGNREMPQIAGEVMVLPKHWFEGTDSSGKRRDVGTQSLEAPLGSGPYRIKEGFVPGHTIAFERVKDHWGKDLPVNIGRNNFDEVRFEYFRDATITLEAFKADQFDMRFENVARYWATAYDFPAVTEKRVVKEEFPIRSSGVMQAFVLNTRRAKFGDPRVRRAFNLALDFEEMNKQFFFGQYTRIDSYFYGTELASSGLPAGLELEILETVRDEVPKEVFTTEYKNPVNGNPEAIRNNLREATRLLREAGWEIKNQKLANAKTGEPMEAEFLLDEPIFERFVLFYKPSLERLGIGVTIRTVDDSQYENRTRAFDFDIIVNSWPQTLSPGNEQRGDWGSRAADRPGSRNLIGINSPAVDKLIDRLVFAKKREELVAATRALDRVLMMNHYVVPQWTYRKVRTARWDRFSHPEKMPEYGAAAFPTIWWWDEAKATKTGGRQ
jgi:microcin C transport system substrate-binding protein